MASRVALRRVSVYGSAIICGILIPSVVNWAIPLEGRSFDFAAFIASFSPSAENFTLWGLHAIPLIILTCVLSCSLPKNHSVIDRELPTKLGAFGAFSVLLIFMGVVNIGVQVGHRGAPPGGSTNAIAFLFMPVYGLLAACVGYALGWAAGALYKKVRT
jgi:hypothetical protein